VTGAGGKLGRLLRAAWTENPPQDLRLLWTGRGNRVQLQWDVSIRPAPALPYGAIVLHLAGVTRGTADQLGQNAAAVPHLLDTCRRIAARKLIFISTAAVYAPGPTPSGEDDRIAPANAYGHSKAQAEALLQAQSDVPVTVLRLGNVAGADALLGPRPPGAGIVLDPVPGHAGGPVRSWIGARTLAQALADLSLRDLPPILNIASAPPLGMAPLLDASGLDWSYGPPNPLVVPMAALDVSLLQSILPLPPADGKLLAAEAAWARGVLA
jgi:nucleoside-diphosphate-sugar epimerase